MNRLELEASLEATYLGKMVECKRPALAKLWDVHSKIGRLENLAVEGETVHLQVNVLGKGLSLIVYPELEDFKDKVTLVTHGNTDRGTESDVFADL
mgnify:CR=1 FL=1